MTLVVPLAVTGEGSSTGRERTPIAAVRSARVRFPSRPVAVLALPSQGLFETDAESLRFRLALPSYPARTLPDRATRAVVRGIETRRGLETCGWEPNPTVARPDRTCSRSPGPPFVSRALHSRLSMVRRSQPSPSRLRFTTAAGQSWDKALGSWSSSSTLCSGRCVRSGPEVVPTDREPPPAPPGGTVTETISSRRSSLDSCGASRASVSAVQSSTDALSQVRWPKADLRQAGERLSF